MSKTPIGPRPQGWPDGFVVRPGQKWKNDADEPRVIVGVSKYSTPSMPGWELNNSLWISEDAMRSSWTFVAEAPKAAAAQSVNPAAREPAAVPPQRQTYETLLKKKLADDGVRVCAGCGLKEAMRMGACCFECQVKKMGGAKDRDGAPRLPVARPFVADVSDFDLLPDA